MSKLSLISITMGIATTGLLVIGCGGGSAGTTTAANVEDYAGPIASKDISTGEEVFATFCEGCHPGGDEGKGPTLMDIDWDAGLMRAQIRLGSGKMPDFGEDKISNSDLEALLAYMKKYNAVH